MSPGKYNVPRFLRISKILREGSEKREDMRLHKKDIFPQRVSGAIVSIPKFGPAKRN
jgi:hypothetical protein